MYKTGNGVDIEFKDIPNKLQEFYDKMKHFDAPFSIVIGTDSQNHDKTKIVCVICMVCEGHGGIFFFKKFSVPFIRDVRTKLHIETNESLNITQELVEILEKDFEDLYLNCAISIHIDAGHSPKGKTHELIPELVGWINAMGYKCEVKPDSFCASSIANKFSKY